MIRTFRLGFWPKKAFLAVWNRTFRPNTSVNLKGSVKQCVGKEAVLGGFLFIVDYLVPKKRSPCFDNFSIFQTIFVFSTLLSPCFHFFCSPFLFRFLDNISTHTQTHYTHTHIIHCHYIKKKLWHVHLRPSVPTVRSICINTLFDEFGLWLNCVCVLNVSLSVKA